MKIINYAICEEVSGALQPIMSILRLSEQVDPVPLQQEQQNLLPTVY